ncbi:MAG: MFS transporter [Mycobacteriales bacterium]
MVAPADAPAASEPRTIFEPSLRSTTFGLVTLITMIAFEAMAVGPALPTAARDLHGIGAYGWAFTAFLIGNVIGMVASGQHSDVHGPRLPLLAGMGLFVAGLLVAGSSATMAQLVVARGIQGLGGGLLITAAYVLIGETYPEALRPKVFAATSSAWLVPSLLGPVVSGVLTEHASWRWVFFGLVPFVLGGSLLMMPIVSTLHRPPVHDRALGDRRRIVRAVVVGLGVAGIEEAGQHPSPGLIAVGVVGAAALAWGIVGLVPSGTFRVAGGVAAPVALRGLLAGAFFGAESLIPLMLSTQHGYAATASGLPLTGAGVTWALGSWFSGRTVAGDPSVRRARLLRAGFCCVAAAVALVGVASLPAAPPWLTYPAWLLAGLGAGLAMPTLSVLLLLHTNDRDRGRDSAALQLSDTTASALTTGLAGILVAAAARAALGYTAAFVALDAAMVVLALVGAAAAGRTRQTGITDLAAGTSIL